MQQDYDFVMKKNILLSEGGYCWDKGDPGGPTKYGITCYDLAAHRGEVMGSMARWAPIVKAMTLDEALDIYAKKYATASRFNDLPAGVDYTVLDYAINSGVGRPSLVLSKLLGFLPQKTMTDAIVLKVKQVDPKQLVHSINQERLHFMHQIRNGAAWEQFGKGWGARVQHVEAVSDQLVDNPIGAPMPQQPSSQPSQAQGKAIHAPDPQKKSAVIKTIGTSTIASQGSHYWLTSEHALMIGAGIIVAGFVGWEIHKALVNRKNQVVELPPGMQPLLPKAA